MSLFIVGMYNPHYASLQRFEKLCRCILSSMEAENEPKVSGVGRGVPKSLPTHKPACLALKVPLECSDYCVWVCLCSCGCAHVLSCFGRV